MQRIIEIEEDMPDIYRYFGFVFFFHSNEHDPIHVHVQHDHHESVFEILMENGAVSNINVRDKKGVPPLSSKEKRQAEAFVREYADNIVAKWVNFFIKKKRVVCTTIKKRMK
ncbi:MAG: DUF4160 domain-containing protein [Bacteroidaceae bacterium]|nr:DUF4160 domain-containing protein [Bacteroidaceae bacterium]